MFPIVFSIPLPDALGGGSFPVGSLGILFACVAVFGAWLSSASARRIGVASFGGADDAGLDLALTLAIGGIVGSKLLHAVVEHERFLADPSAFLSLREAGVFYGALLGGGLAVVLRAKQKGWSLAAAADALAPTWAIGHGVLRVGCFLAGCCYGVPSSYGVRFPSNSAAYTSLLAHDPSWLDGGQTVPLFPIQLVEAAFELLLGGALWTLLSRRVPRGAPALVYVAAYAAFRFASEHVRGDPERGAGALGLVSTTQLISALLFVAAIVGLARLLRGTFDAR